MVTSRSACLVEPGMVELLLGTVGQGACEAQVTACQIVCVRRIPEKSEVDWLRGQDDRNRQKGH